MSLHDKLQSLFAKDFPLPDKPIVRVNANDHLAQACKLLAEHNIHSVPVYSPEDPNMVIGMLDVLDVVWFIVTKVAPHDFHQVPHTAEFRRALVSDAADHSERSPYVPVSGNTHMYGVIELLGNCGNHRALVQDELSGQLSNIITQSAVIKQFSQHIEDLGPVGQKSVRQLNLGSCPVYSVNIESSTLEAFQLLREKKTYGIAVVDEAQQGGAIVTVLSAKDARFIVQDLSRAKLLTKPLRAFLAALRAQDNPVNIRTLSITCNKNDTLATIWSKFAKSGVHRIYEVDEHNRPITAITLTDVLQAILQATQAS